MANALADESQSLDEWANLIKELNHIENVTTGSTLLQFDRGCSVIEEYKSEKGDILSHRFDCLGKKLSVVYQGTFAIIFLEDQQEVRIIDLSTVKDKMGVKKLIVHLLDKEGVGIASPLGSSATQKIFSNVPKVLKYAGLRRSAFRMYDWFQKYSASSPVEKFSMKEFASQYRHGDLTSGEGVGKMAITFEKDKLSITPRNTTSNRFKSFSTSMIPILGGYVSNFYLQLERGDMFQAGKTLKLLDDLVNEHPEELGFLKGHTQEDRNHAHLLMTEIAKTSGIDEALLKKNLEDLHDSKVQGKLGSSESFYKELQKSDTAIKKRAQEEEKAKKKGFFGRMLYKAKKLVTQNDSRYTIEDVYEDYVDKFSRAPLERINPLLNVVSSSKLFRNEAVHAGYLAETYYRQNEKELYNKAVAMPSFGEEYIPNFDAAQGSIRNAQAVFARNLCPSLESNQSLNDDEQRKLKQIQDDIDDVEELFSHDEKKFFGSKTVGIAEDFRLSAKAMMGKPNFEKAMKNLNSGMRKLELAAGKILSLQNQLKDLSPKSPKYQVEHLRLVKLMGEWGRWNGYMRENMENVMEANLSLAKKGKPLTPLAADLAYLYDENPHDLDLSPGGPKANYLELNRWFTKSSDLPAQISATLEKGKVVINPPEASEGEEYTPNYKVFEDSEPNSNLLKERYTTRFTVDDYKRFQERAKETYEAVSAKKSKAKKPAANPIFKR